MIKTNLKNIKTQLFNTAVALCALLVLPSHTHAGEMQSSLSSTESLGWSVSVSGTIGLASAYTDDTFPVLNHGSAYIFRNLNTATGTITQNLRLWASDKATNDYFGHSVSLSGTIGLVGAVGDDIGANADQGSAYVFRNLDTATGTITQNAKLIASDGNAGDWFGYSVSLSDTTGLVGAYKHKVGANFFQGAAYVFRNLDTVSGTTPFTQNAKLVASDGAIGDSLGFSVSLSGTIGLVGAYGNAIGSNPAQGSAYVFRNLDTATGTITQNAKLIGSDGGPYDEFGRSVSLSGTIGLVGAHYHDIGANTNQGAAYIFRNLHTATGTITQNAKLIASDGATNDYFGYSVSISGTIGLVGAYYDDIGSKTDQGSAYIFRNLDTASGTVNENVKIFASNGDPGDYFGQSVSLDGDRFVIGAPYNDTNLAFDHGSVYFGHVRTFTTANLGSDATVTDGISFEARDNWIIGQSTSNNSVTLNSGDTGNVGRVGLVNPTTAQTYIGQNSGSSNNTLHVESGATLTSNSINVGNTGNSGNQLRANGTINLSSSAVLDVFAGNILSGAGIIQGHASNTTNNVVISGSLRPGSGAGGSGIGTLTRNNGNVTWNGNASSPWVFELGIAQATLALANTGGTRDLLNITGGGFLKGTGSSFVFDFAGTGSPGWYKLVDWTTTTTFSATDFTATNLSPSVSLVGFVVDNATSALYINLQLIPEPQVWALLSALLGTLVVIRQRLRKAARAQTTSAT
jgi:hypothetical protein